MIIKYKKVGKEPINDDKAIKKDLFLILAGDELYNKINANVVTVIVNVNVNK